jgi:hypothetical protein
VRSPYAPRRFAVWVAPHDERHPELHDVDARAVNPPEVEELRPPVGPVVVMHGHLGDPEAGVLDLLHHFQTNDAAVFLEAHVVENRPAHHSKVAVNIANGETEQRLDDVVIDPSDENAVPGV